MELIFGTIIWLLAWMLPVAVLLVAGYQLVSLPMRRRERARAFLTLVDTALRDGQNVEQTLVAMSRTRDPGLGPRFHALAALLLSGHSLSQALDRITGLVPGPVAAMLKAGEEAGDLHQVIPACRQFLKDGLALTRGSLNYLFSAACLTTPILVLIYTMITIFVLPKYQEIAAAMNVDNPLGVRFLLGFRGVILPAQLCFMVVVWVVAFVYVGGPVFSAVSPGTSANLFQRLQYCLPWRRHRMQRDFAVMLGILLDADVTETDAVRLAADCTGNCRFREGAERAAKALAQGVKLPDAVRLIDDSKEFRWRLEIGLRENGNFSKSFRGWADSLEARAAGEEQATASVMAGGIILVNGLFVGTVVVSVFSVITSVINSAVLW